MIPTTFRLLVKSLRFEIAAVLVGALLLAGAALVVTAHLNSLGMPRDCLYEVSGPPPVEPTAEQAAHDAACGAKRQTFYILVNEEADRVFALMAVFPIGGGLIVGVPLVAREIEWGTAPLAWTLARSRRRWLVGRAVPLGVVLAVVLAAPAFSGQLLEGAAEPSLDPGASFQDFGLRGAPLIGLGVLSYGVAVAIGTAMGRQLPALIVAGCMAVGLLVVSDGALRTLGRGFTSVVDASTVEVPLGSFVVDEQIRDPDGVLHPIVNSATYVGDGPPGGGTYVWLLLPGDRYPAVASVFSGVLAAVALGLVGASAEIIERRRAS
ncbi:MAG TPA: hypothetical protein VFW86_04205 [Candidatus Limnocylindrales bacterium]|nr:hypothetical protein [Candidatus Limnocylindrales bacterium]